MSILLAPAQADEGCIVFIINSEIDGLEELRIDVDLSVVSTHRPAGLSSG